MRRSLLSLTMAFVALAGTTVARAADAPTAQPIPAEFVAIFAPTAAEQLAKQFPDPPVKVDADAAKTMGFHVENKIGVVIMPDKAITSKAVEECAGKEVPVGVVTMLAATLQGKDAAAIPADKIAIVDVDGSIKLPIFFLTVKGKEAERSLEVYSKDKTTLLSIPLKKVEGDKEAAAGVKIQNIDLDKKTMELVFNIPGAYQSDAAKVSITAK